jgi:hypothetical protein
MVVYHGLTLFCPYSCFINVVCAASCLKPVGPMKDRQDWGQWRWPARVRVGGKVKQVGREAFLWKILLICEEKGLHCYLQIYVTYYRFTLGGGGGPLAVVFVHCSLPFSQPYWQKMLLLCHNYLRHNSLREALHVGAAAGGMMDWLQRARCLLS